MNARLWTTPLAPILVLLVVSCRPAPPENSEVRPVAILGASAREVALLEEHLSGPVRQEIEGLWFVSGELAGGQVVVGRMGVGKVNAAMTATLLIEHFRPVQVLVTGIAGGVDPNLAPGDMVIAERTAHHDMGILWPEGMEQGGVRNPLTGDDNPTFFPADGALLAAAKRAGGQVVFDPVARRTGPALPRVVVGTVATGDAFIASESKCTELAQALGAHAVEMEGAAVAQVCHQRSIGCLVVRSLADKADESAVLDKQEFFELAARNSARLVIEIVHCLHE